MKCFVCQKEYDENNKETAFVTVGGRNVNSISIYKDNCLNLCPQCLRQTYISAYVNGISDCTYPESQGMFYGAKKIKEVDE